MHSYTANVQHSALEPYLNLLGRYSAGLPYSALEPYPASQTRMVPRRCGMPRRFAGEFFMCKVWHFEAFFVEGLLHPYLVHLWCVFRSFIVLSYLCFLILS